MSKVSSSIRIKCQGCSITVFHMHYSFQVQLFPDVDPNHVDQLRERYTGRVNAEVITDVICNDLLENGYPKKAAAAAATAATPDPETSPEKKVGQVKIRGYIFVIDKSAIFPYFMVLVISSFDLNCQKKMSFSFFLSLGHY